MLDGFDLFVWFILLTFFFFPIFSFIFLALKHLVMYTYTFSPFCHVMSEDWTYYTIIT